MSVARPARCLLSRRLPATGSQVMVGGGGVPLPLTPAPRCCVAAPFHSSAQLAKRKPRFKSIRAVDMGLVTPEKIDEFTQKTFPKYTPEELEVLRGRYTPEQMAALEAGEAAIDPKDLTIQGRLRRDPYRPRYLDDFSRILPIVDKQPRTLPPPPEKVRFMSAREHADDLSQVLDSLVPKGVNFDGLTDEQMENLVDEKADLDIAEAKFFEERSTLVGHDQPSNSALAPSLGKNLRGVAGMYSDPIDPEDDGDDKEGKYTELKKRMGFRLPEIIALTGSTKRLVVRHVTNQTRLGKILSVSVLAVAGNKDGRLGIGEAKSVEYGVAVSKARERAMVNMQPIPRYENRTIFGRVQGKVGATIVRLESRPPGFGLRASHRLFEMFRACGIQDIAASMPRARNPMNSVKACMQALLNQPNPNAIAAGRGKKMIDLRKVYYGGNVL